MSRVCFHNDESKKLFRPGQRRWYRSPQYQPQSWSSQPDPRRECYQLCSIARQLPSLGMIQQREPHYAARQNPPKCRLLLDAAEENWDLGVLADQQHPTEEPLFCKEQCQCDL